jgi:hypothetical protein
LNLAKKLNQFALNTIHVWDTLKSEKLGPIVKKEIVKRCIDCSSSQQIKCFGIEVVGQGIGKNRKCQKK